MGSPSLRESAGARTGTHVQPSVRTLGRGSVEIDAHALLFRLQLARRNARAVQIEPEIADRTCEIADWQAVDPDLARAGGYRNQHCGRCIAPPELMPLVLFYRIETRMARRKDVRPRLDVFSNVFNNILALSSGPAQLADDGKSLSRDEGCDVTLEPRV